MAIESKFYERNLKTMRLTTDPFQGLCLFEGAMTRMMSDPRTACPWSPAVDVLETEHDSILKADLPDVELKDIDRQVENQTLTIKGYRHFERETLQGKGGYHRIERSSGILFEVSRCRRRWIQKRLGLNTKTGS